MTDTAAAAAAPLPPISMADEPIPDLLPDDARFEMRWGGAIAIGFFVIFLGWAAITPLDAGAYAMGSIAVTGNRQAVQYREGGTVTAIYAKDGDTVVKGQLLAEISTDELRGAERGIAAQTITLLAQRARLTAERDGRAGFAAPPEFAALTGADRVTANEAMIMQRKQFEVRRLSLVTQQGVLTQRISQLSEQINGFNRQLDANRQQQQLIGDELTGMKKLRDQGYAPENRVRSLERDAAGLAGQDGSLQADMARSNEAIGEAKMQGVSLIRQMQEEVAGQLRDVQVQLDELQPKWVSAKQQLARAEVRAPAGGKVIATTIFTVGGVVSPGQVLMEIVPQDKALIIAANVKPDDADDLRVGQKTQIRFSALHERDLPILEGRVMEISPDAFTDEKSGQRYFKAQVSVPPSEIAKIIKVRGSATGISPGLPVQVLIPLEKRTALAYLFEPLLQTFWKAGREH